MKKAILKGAICVLVVLLLMPTLTAKESNNNGNKINENICIAGNNQPGTMPLDDQIDQSQESAGGGAVLCGSWKWAQSFRPSLDVLTRVVLLMYKLGDVNDIKISIRDNLRGSDLTSVTKSPSEIPTETPDWIEFDFEDIGVTPGKTYYIVYSTTGGDNKENFYSLRHSIGDTYDKGDAWIGWNYGRTWEIWGTQDWEGPKFDFCFETYGRMNQMPGKPAKPSGSALGVVGKEYTYKTSSNDPDGDKISYGWDWDGDMVVDEWTDYYDAGTEISITHSWNDTGMYYVRVKARDKVGGESDWSDPMSVIMPIKMSTWGILEKINEWMMQTFGKELLPMT